MSNAPKSILIAYVTAGAGHRRAAEALAQAMTRVAPEWQVQCHDLLDDVPVLWRHFYPWIYYTLVRRVGWLWGAGFECLDRRTMHRLVQPFRSRWNLLMARRFLARLRRAPPDLVIVTHFFPADVVSTCKRFGWFHGAFLIVITDFYPHRFWLSSQADAHICATEEVARAAAQRGIPSERLRVLGIPIARDFHAQLDRPEARELFGLAPERLTVLVTSGGSTVGPFESVVSGLADLERTLPNRLQLLVLCGEHAAVAQRLRGLAKTSSMPIRVFEFIDRMPQAMAVSDLLVTKAGGLTVAEALSCGVPLVLYFAIPGQERFNARYVSERGAAILAEHPTAVVQAVRRFLEDPQVGEAMRAAARTIRRPDAADLIVSQVVKPLLSTPQRHSGGVS